MFEALGLDYLEPITVKMMFETAKRWIALFTCLSTRMLYLEVVKNQTASAFLHSLRRFVAPNGCPALIISDNAAQFRLVPQALKCDESVNREDELTLHVAKKGIRWRNVTPRAPWTGELMDLTKKALKHATGRKLLQEQELITMTTEIEGVLNSRPITYVHGELAAITPNRLYTTKC